MHNYFEIFLPYFCYKKIKADNALSTCSKSKYYNGGQIIIGLFFGPKNSFFNPFSSKKSNKTIGTLKK
jgi:hypothetical protein